MDADAIDKAPDAAAAWPDQIYDLLKKHDIRQVCLVPDAGHSRLIKRCLADNEIIVTTLTTEEEGIALMQGAWLGGHKAVLLMQSSGVGNCINMLSLSHIHEPWPRTNTWASRSTQGIRYSRAGWLPEMDGAECAAISSRLGE